MIKDNFLLLLQITLEILRKILYELNDKVNEDKGKNNE